MKLLTQLFLGTLIIVKIVLGSVFIYQAESDPLVSERDAIASEEVQEEPAAAIEETDNPAFGHPGGDKRENCETHAIEE